MWRCQIESQSKVWNGVQLGALLELPPLMLDGRKVGVHRERELARRPRLLGCDRGPGGALARGSAKAVRA